MLSAHRGERCRERDVVVPLLQWKQVGDGAVGYQNGGRLEGLAVGGRSVDSDPLVFRVDTLEHSSLKFGPVQFGIFGTPGRFRDRPVMTHRCAAPQPERSNLYADE